MLLLITKREKIRMDFISFFEIFMNVWRIFCQQGFLGNIRLISILEIIFKINYN
jgi:hypothetical protein